MPASYTMQTVLFSYFLRVKGRDRLKIVRLSGKTGYTANFEAILGTRTCCFSGKKPQ